MPRQLDRQGAEGVAIQALSFIGQDDERLGLFMSLTGVDGDGLRRAAADPHFLESVLDHVCSDETLLIAFAESSGLKPELVAQAWAALSGPPPED